MSGLRVIGGKARGRRLRSVPGDTTRPITDRAKESLFNILAGDLPDSSFLDLFAGTGSVGIEALSRGAAFARFLDTSRQAIETIRHNLVDTSLETNAEVLRLDAFTLLERPPDRQFELVFVAPPQYKELWKRTLLSLDAHPTWLSASAWVIVQIHPVEYAPMELQNLTEFEQRRYGSTLFVFYEKNEA
ncbi:MAG: 16S rRNA (guanine(966)-N(2))-methyltransferase RsmD [Anaerolineales bacterium]|nr:16S rRNA (guanine(966)-N(2))-methyltransferase RsmD [Anaerolineales bacterium]